MTTDTTSGAPGVDTSADSAATSSCAECSAVTGAAEVAAMGSALAALAGGAAVTVSVRGAASTAVIGRATRDRAAARLAGAGRAVTVEGRPVQELTPQGGAAKAAMSAGERNGAEKRR